MDILDIDIWFFAEAVGWYATAISVDVVYNSNAGISASEKTFDW